MELMYLRKSRADGEHESVEAVLQRHEQILQEFALNTYGHTIGETHIFREVVSGETIQARPAMCRLLELLQTRSIDAVLVVDPQRLSRGDLRDCGTVIRAFRYTGTCVATPQKIYDLADKFDRKFLEMELMRGNDYLEYVKEIMLRGRIASVREGNYIGSVPPFGYDKIRVGKSYTLTENAESDAVRLIFALYVQEQLGYTEICSRLDALGIKPRKKPYWVPSSIREILQNPVYIGKIRWNWRKTIKQYRDGEIVKSRPKSPEPAWILLDGRHPPLVSESLFRQAQERRGSTPRTVRPLANPFAGLCRCTCGAAMIRKPFSDAQDRILCREQNRCHNRSAVFSVWETTIFSALHQVLPALEVQYQPPEMAGRHLQTQLLENVRRELWEIEKQQEKLFDLLERGIYSEEIFQKRNAALSERRTAAQSALLHTVPEAPTIPPHLLTLEAAVTALEQDVLTPQQKNAFLQTILQEIRYASPPGSDVPFTLTIFLQF